MGDPAIDGGLVIVVGVIATLVGFRNVGQKVTECPPCGIDYRRYSRWLKWAGPITIFVGLVLMYRGLAG